jgi:hypothetical protein
MVGFHEYFTSLCLFGMNYSHIFVSSSIFPPCAFEELKKRQALQQQKLHSKLPYSEIFYSFSQLRMDTKISENMLRTV